VAVGRDRGAARRLAAEIRRAPRLRVLPPRVASFHWRARRVAARAGDQFSLVSATRPADLGQLLELARGRRRVVELGTATAWTAISLAISDPARQVTSFDPVERPERQRYLSLVGAGVRRRVELVTAPGASGPRAPGPVDLLYIDSSHERQETIDELRAWQPVLGGGALVVLDDYDHPQYPGVREAVRELGLSGEQLGTLFVHEVGGGGG
jgi:predicted O-methyltransferase YrrM